MMPTSLSKNNSNKHHNALVLFEDRKEAGSKLAQKLEKFAAAQPLVLAIPRGGVIVGYEVALFLEATLDTVIARKIGSPFNNDVTIGAVAPGDIIMINIQAVNDLGLDQESLDPIIEREIHEMERRMFLYGSGEYGKDHLANTVIIVDDGFTTGVTARAAVESVRLVQRAEKVVYATPICTRDTAAALRDVAELVCLENSHDITTAGKWYDEFVPSDREVVDLLKRAQEIHKGTA
jgi:putative phosphoribosyl transferase